LLRDSLFRDPNRKKITTNNSKNEVVATLFNLARLHINPSNRTPVSNSLNFLQTRDLRGLAALLTSASIGVTDVSENLHQRIAFPVGAAPGRTRGITGLVYRSVRGIMQLVGISADALLKLARTDELSVTTSSTPARENFLAILNGVFGDYLFAQNNALAIRMCFRTQGKPLTLSANALREELPVATNKIAVLIHGLCMHDGHWLNADSDHLTLLRELGYSVIFLHYNSGKAIAENGAELAQLMSTLSQEWPLPVDEITVVAHSMGGLLIRSAFVAAETQQHTWPQQLRRIIFLGTPHHGSPLERAGHWLDKTLEATPFAAAFAPLGKRRSAGITDLRHGYFCAQQSSLGAIPALPDGVRCYAVAATLNKNPNAHSDQWIGDGLVPVSSALGQHVDPARNLAIAPENTLIARGVGHIELLSDAGITAQIAGWLATDGTAK
jgi:pimeloyl-ACP methyl ester carboxylesterase